MRPLASQIWPGGYAFRPFKVISTDIEFRYSRTNARDGLSNGEIKGSNISAVWNPHLQETLINGVLQGRKQIELKGASALSNMKMSELFIKASSCCDTPSAEVVMKISTYRDLKGSLPLRDRQHVKTRVKETALPGWGAKIDYT